MNLNFYSSNEIIENCKQRKYTLLTKIKQNILLYPMSDRNDEFYQEVEKQIIELFDSQNILKEEERLEESKMVNELIIDIIDSIPQIDKLNTKYIKAFCLYEVGYFYLTQTKQYEEASDYFALSCSFYESLGDKYAFEYCSAQTNCSFALYLSNKVDESLSYAENSFSILNSLVSSPQKRLYYEELYGYTNDILAVLYMESGREEDATRILEAKLNTQFPIIDDEKVAEKRSVTPPKKTKIAPPITTFSSNTNPRIKKKNTSVNPRLKRFKSSDNFYVLQKDMFAGLEKSINNFLET